MQHMMWHVMQVLLGKLQRTSLSDSGRVEEVASPAIAPRCAWRGAHGAHDGGDADVCCVVRRMAGLTIMA